MTRRRRATVGQMRGLKQPGRVEAVGLLALEVEEALGVNPEAGASGGRGSPWASRGDRTF